MGRGRQHATPPPHSAGSHLTSVCLPCAHALVDVEPATVVPLRPIADCELVLVSSDTDEEAYETYRAKMPWPALPFSAQDKKIEVAERFGVKAVPRLVVVDKHGNLVVRNGRKDLSECPDLAMAVERWRAAAAAQAQAQEGRSRVAGASARSASGKPIPPPPPSPTSGTSTSTTLG